MGKIKDLTIPEYDQHSHYWRSMRKTGWFADISDEGPKGYPWQPCLQLDFYCMNFDTWFQTREECEQWIRDEVLGQGMYDDSVGDLGPKQ